MLLFAFLGAVATGFGRTARAARKDPLARAAAVAAGGIFTAWLIQTSVDWLHLIPGLTAVALAAAVALLASPTARAPVNGRPRIAWIATAAAIACAGAVTIGPRVLSLHSQDAAQRALADHAPRVAIADATKALDYDARSVPALVLRAAGFARLQAFAPALADFRRATALEPHNWTTWALLGDLFTRHGNGSLARSAYAHALALDPLESDLRMLSQTSASPSKPRP